VGSGEVRPQAQGVAEVLDGLGEAAQALHGQAEAAEHLGGIRLQAQGGAAGAGSALVLTKGAVDLGEVGVIGGGVGSQRGGPADELDGAGVLSLLVVQQTQHVQGVGVIGLLLQKR
jgi:hypothetical protein